MSAVSRVAVVLVLFCGCWLGSAALAAPYGSLVRMPGKLGCLAEFKDPLRIPRSTCAAERIGPVVDIELSSDGRHLYGATAYTIWTFGRDPATGMLQRARGRRGCIRAHSRQPRCTLARAMSGIRQIAISPDGRHVYAAAEYSRSITILRRDSATGRLTQARGRGGCISQFRGPCRRGHGGFAVPIALTVSPDGHTVYVGSSASIGPGNGSVAILARNTRSGSLRQAVGAAGCLSDRGDEDCTPARGIDFVSTIIGTPDGRSVYVAARATPGTLAVFRRKANGRLKQLGAERGCLLVRRNVRARRRMRCCPARGLDQPASFVVSPDSRSLYVGAAPHRVLAFTRMRDGSLRQLPGRNGCVSWFSGYRCVAARGFSYPSGGAVSTEGRNVYFGTEHGMAAFRRNRNGALRQLAAEFGCHDSFGVGEEGCLLTNLETDDGLPKDVVTSPDGRHVYMGSPSLIELFRRTP
jgi:Lactonase, 7-bladed beta-propeller